ncbi:MAG: 2,3-bisphosphoglycerate-independent phosphoglycerate mutase, partial [bacterium]
MVVDFPTTELSASGLDVGLPEGQMGNSEVGHLNLGAGRIVYQDITRIDKAIETGEFFKNPALIQSIEYAQQKRTGWHLMGLVSDGGVHSSLNHLFALINFAHQMGLKKVFIHAFTDGRDTSPHSGVKFISRLTEYLQHTGVGKIATVCGRYYAMDRDRRWERTLKAYKMLVEGEGHFYSSAETALLDSYQRRITDEFVEPSIISSNGSFDGQIRPGDAILFFNFRADRARQLVRALGDPHFTEFPRKYLNLNITTMTQYQADFPYSVLFPPQGLNNILGEVLSQWGIKQFRIAETEKYAHVTYFFNGGRESPFPGEDRSLIASPKVATYDQMPEMSAQGVAERALEALDQDYQFILLNFANPDMVGHTGILSAAIQALEALDPLVDALVSKAVKKGWTIIITADHGNCEQMIEADGSPHTAHTSNLVPFVVIDSNAKYLKLRKGGRLADVAPTILKILNLPQPPEMDGKCLII